MKRDCDPVGAVARRQDLLFESLLNPFQAAAESELLKPQRLLLKAGAPACGHLCMADHGGWRSEEHTSELQTLMRISYAVFCLNNQLTQTPTNDRAPRSRTIITRPCSRSTFHDERLTNAHLHKATHNHI